MTILQDRPLVRPRVWGKKLLRSSPPPTPQPQDHLPALEKTPSVQQKAEAWVADPTPVLFADSALAAPIAQTQETVVKAPESPVEPQYRPVQPSDIIRAIQEAVAALVGPERVLQTEVRMDGYGDEVTVRVRMPHDRHRYRPVYPDYRDYVGRDWFCDCSPSRARLRGW